ncbi:partial FeMo cofactor biosynthesis protein NifB, partial [Methylacidimicrobium cyclopophantes]
ADAVGLLGEDRGAEFTTERIESIEIRYDSKKREAYRNSVEEERAARKAARERELLTLAGENSDRKILLAVATKGGGKVNEHFGHAKEFQIYEVSTAGSKFVGHRRVDLYCQGGYGEEDALAGVIRAINDCVAVLVAKIGACPKEELRKAGIEPVDEYAYGYIETAALSYYRGYLERLKIGAIAEVERGDAMIRQGAFVEAGAPASAAA